MGWLNRITTTVSLIAFSFLFSYYPPRASLNIGLFILLTGVLFVVLWTTWPNYTHVLKHQNRKDKKPLYFWIGLMFCSSVLLAWSLANGTLFSVSNYDIAGVTLALGSALGAWFDSFLEKRFVDTGRPDPTPLSMTWDSPPLMPSPEPAPAFDSSGRTPIERVLNS
jgi:hypothetical protein